jgi:hypothetical protein
MRYVGRIDLALRPRRHVSSHNEAAVVRLWAGALFAGRTIAQTLARQAPLRSPVIGALIDAMDRPQKITFGKVRALGVHGIQIDCSD